MQVQFLGQEDPLKKEMATHSSILDWEIPWTEEPDGLQSKGSQRVRHDLTTKQQQMHRLFEISWFWRMQIWFHANCIKILGHLNKRHGLLGFPGGSEVKAFASNTGDLGSIPGSGRSPGEGNGNPIQYSCLENPMDGGAWWATVHGVAKSRTRLSDFTHGG